MLCIIIIVHIKIFSGVCGYYVHADRTMVIWLEQIETPPMRRLHVDNKNGSDVSLRADEHEWLGVTDD
jgi:hypothetical protein